MKLTALLGERFKKAPSDCVVESQALMVRGGYIKSVGTGVFSLFMPAKRITKKSKTLCGRRWTASTDRRSCSPL